jgi:uncharacterized protein involved in exopolysaccharide biosynthesis
MGPKAMTRAVFLAVLGLTILGGLGGFLGAAIQPALYQADAFVVVYDMPSGFNNLIGPDQANNLNAFYAAGALQDSVIQRVRARYPNLTPDQIRQAVQVSIVAYTPLTRVSATGGSAQVATALANAVASAWVAIAGNVITQAYDSTYAILTAHQQQLASQIKATQAALNAARPSSTKAQTLTAQLQTLNSAYASTDANLTALENERYYVAGNAYVATPASASTVTRIPDVFRSLLTGSGVGLGLGIVCALWLIRAASRIAPPPPLAAQPPRRVRTTQPVAWDHYDD